MTLNSGHVTPGSLDWGVKWHGEGTIVPSPEKSCYLSTVTCGKQARPTSPPFFTALSVVS